jgi:hypothetical protein
MFPAAPQETVGEAGIEPGTAAWLLLVDLTTELTHPQTNFTGVGMFVRNPGRFEYSFPFLSYLSIYTYA